MEKCIGKKTEYSKKSFAALSVFFVLRALFISSASRTGIETDPPSATVMPVNAVFMLLSAVLGVLLAYTICTAYGKSDKKVHIPLVLIAADPILPYSVLNCISIFIGILFLITVLNILKEKPVVSRTAAAIIFMTISGLVMPSSLYVFVPVFLSVYFLGNVRKNIIPIIISLLAFTVSALVNTVVVNSSYEVRSFIFQLSFSENTALINSDTSLNSSLAAKLSFVFVIAAILYLSFRIRNAKTEKLPQKNIQELIRSDIFTAAFILVEIILCFIGVFLCGMEISVFTLTAVSYIVLINSKNSIAENFAEKIYDFITNHYFVLVIILCVSSVILLSIKNPGSIYSSAANSFI